MRVSGGECSLSCYQSGHASLFRPCRPAHLKDERARCRHITHEIDPEDMPFGRRCRLTCRAAHLARINRTACGSLHLQVRRSGRINHVYEPAMWRTTTGRRGWQTATFPRLFSSFAFLARATRRSNRTERALWSGRTGSGRSQAEGTHRITPQNPPETSSCTAGAKTLAIVRRLRLR